MVKILAYFTSLNMAKNMAEKTFNNYFLHCHWKWLLWAIAFHIAKFSQYLARIGINFTLELYSSNQKQGKDENVKD